MTPAEIQKERSKQLRLIKKLITPLLRPSGYRKRTKDGNSRPLMVWVPRDANGNATLEPFTIRGTYVLNDIEGVTEEGVITDSVGVALVTTYWRGLPLEDLYRLANWFSSHMPKLLEEQKAFAAA